MEPIQMTVEILALLFLGGLIAGFVDSIAGGGGLIALPIILSCNIPPQIALGTNKLQGTFGTLSSSYNYIRKGQVDFKEAKLGIVFTFIGAALGSLIVQLIKPSIIKDLIPILLGAVLIYTFFSKKLGYEERQAKLSHGLFFSLFGLGLGFYDGFFGPGTGSFWTAAMLVFLGLDMIKASGFTRVMNFVSNIVALTIFIIGGKVVFSAGICMGIGQLIGARLGSNLAIEKGAAFIRPVFMAVVLITIIRLVYVNMVN